MSDEKPKRMADMQAEVSWNRIGPFDLDHLREEFDRARASEKRLATEVRSAFDDMLRGWPIDTVLERPDEFASADGGIRGAIVSLAALQRIAAALSEVES